MRIFVTGGTGFIGTYVIRALLKKGHEVLALKRPGSLPSIPLAQQPVWLEGSLEEDWSEALSRCCVLVHLAAIGVSPKKATWQEFFRWNVNAAVNLMQQAVETGVKRIVNCGSCVEFGRAAESLDFIPNDAALAPVGGYAASKAAASMAAIGLCQEHGIELALLRPFTIYGEGQFEKNFWPQLKYAARNGSDFEMTGGEQIRDFLSVDRCADAFALAAERTDLQAGQPWVRNLASGQPQSMRSFAKTEWKRLDGTASIKLGARPYRANEVMRYVPRIQPDLWKPNH